MSTVNDFALTLDIDWAPDCVIDDVARILKENEVRATWFVTHRSEAVERLRHVELFELGIHPNMLAGSTHGKTEDEVMAHVRRIVPSAISMRTHGLYQTSNFLKKAAREYGVAIDVSLFLPRAAALRPHRLTWSGLSLWRIPYFWEDDSEMWEDEPLWDVSDHRLDVCGLKVFDFHPVHVALNTEAPERYEELKRTHPFESWDRELVEKKANKGDGPRTLFLGLVQKLRGKGRQVREIISTVERT